VVTFGSFWLTLWLNGSIDRMSGSGNTDVQIFNGFFRHGLDDKRRVQIPSKWRPAEPGDNFELTLIIWPAGGVAQACLSVLAPHQMKTLAEKIAAMPAGDPRAAALRRLLGGRSANVSLDKNGRILLPDFAAKAVGIDKEVLLVGAVDRYEIWDPERYKATMAVDENLLNDAFALI
jgi:MraZ protein